MNFSSLFLARGAIWTAGTFIASQTIRFATNVALSRMLSPELFGLMIVINVIRTGLELISDVGIGQSVIRDKSGDDPTFYNTAWTLQILRGVVLTCVCILGALPLAKIFNLPILASVLPVAALQLVLASLCSMGTFLVRRRLQFVRSGLFEFSIQAIGTLILLSAVYLSPNIWGLVWGGIAYTGAWTLMSYLLVPDLSYRLIIARKYLRRILSFGKWIFASSIIYFLSTNFDRLYLAKMVPLEQLGIYGLARAIGELVNMFFVRMGDILIFPLIARAAAMDRLQLRQKVVRTRGAYLLIAAIGIASAATIVDVPFKLIFDARYYEASQLLCLLILGAWLAVLSATVEASLLGLGKPGYATVANALKLSYLIIVLPFAVPFGLFWTVVTFVTGDLVKYAPMAIGAIKERFSFLTQDILLTVIMLASFLIFQFVRATLGFEKLIWT